MITKRHLIFILSTLMIGFSSFGCSISAKPEKVKLIPINQYMNETIQMSVFFDSNTIQCLDRYPTRFFFNLVYIADGKLKVADNSERSIFPCADSNKRLKASTKITNLKNNRKKTSFRIEDSQSKKFRYINYDGAEGLVPISFNPQSTLLLAKNYPSDKQNKDIVSAKQNLVVKNTYFLFDVETGKLKHNVVINTYPLQLGSAGQENGAYVYLFPSETYSALFSRDGKHIILYESPASSGNLIRNIPYVLDYQSGKTTTPTNFSMGEYSMMLNSDGHTLIFRGQRDGIAAVVDHVEFWSFPGMKKLNEFERDVSPHNFGKASFSPDRSTMLLTDCHNEKYMEPCERTFAQFVDTKTGKVDRTVETPGALSQVIYHPRAK